MGKDAADGADRAGAAPGAAQRPEAQLLAAAPDAAQRPEAQLLAAAPGAGSGADTPPPPSAVSPAAGAPASTLNPHAAPWQPPPPSLEQLRVEVTISQELCTSLRVWAAGSLPKPAKDRVRDLENWKKGTYGTTWERGPPPDSVDQASRLLSDFLKFFERLCLDETFHKLQEYLQEDLKDRIATLKQTTAVQRTAAEARRRAAAVDDAR